MSDWREQHNNCNDCAEFLDNANPTSMCKICECFNCTHSREECLNSRWCQRDNIEIE